MEEKDLVKYLQEIWNNPEGSLARHLALRDKFTVALTDQAHGTFEWASRKICRYLKSNETILDIGCGDGQYLAFLFGQDSLIKYGVGLDRHNRLEETRSKFSKFNPENWALVRGNALELPFEPAVFTAAMANRMLNQTGDIAGALAEAAWILIPGGLLFAVTADSENGSFLREVHNSHQAQPGFPGSLFQRTTLPGQRLNLQNGTAWLNPNFKNIRLEKYERVVVFKDLTDILEYYACGLLFHRASHPEALALGWPPWASLYRQVEQEMEKKLQASGQVEIREGAALFIAQK